MLDHQAPASHLYVAKVIIFRRKEDISIILLLLQNILALLLAAVDVVIIICNCNCSLIFFLIVVVVIISLKKGCLPSSYDVESILLLFNPINDSKSTSSHNKK